MKKRLKTKNLFLIPTITLTFLSSLLMPFQVKASNENSTLTDTLSSEPIPILGYLGENLSNNDDNISTYSYSPGNAENIVYQIMNNTFFIKNAYSGRYLDVYGGSASDGTNVQQCSYNGGSNQQWYINYNGDGTFSFLSAINKNYALDVYGASNSNFANINLWSHHSGDSQKFKIGYTATSTYVISTKISNYEKAVVVHNNGCSDEDNVNQFKYSGNWNELWILEPVNRNIELGVKYAIDNALNTSSVFVYPSYKTDCTNFVSQCLLASGIHYRDEWYIYRKNGFYHNNIDANYQVNYSWDISNTWCWPVAQNFRNFWLDRVSKKYMIKGSAIVQNPQAVWNLGITRGTVVQIADYNNGLQDSWHSMIVTGYTDNSDGYILTYHTDNTLSKTLAEVANSYQDKYFVFLEF